MKIQQVVAKTHTGQRRQQNEDSHLVVKDVPLLVVADGVGGRQAGEIASNLAVESLSRAAERIRAQAARVARDRSTQSRLGLGALMENALESANNRIRDEAMRRGKPGMATTAVAAVVAGDHAYIAHVGDSRAYLFRDGALRRLTDDHNLATLWYRQGRGALADLQLLPDAGYLYQALGASGHLEVDTAEVALADRDVLLICSDGLYGPVPDDVIAAALDRPDLEISAEQLIQAANDAGGPDNITLVVARVGAPSASYQPGEVATLLRSVFLFRELSDPERMVIAPYLEERRVGGGEVVVREGDSADEFFLILDGRVRITRGGTYLTDIGARGHFGEFGLVPGNRRSATATAVEDTFLYVLSREHFQEIIRLRPVLGSRLVLSLLESMGDRMRDLTDRIAVISRVANGDLKLTVPGRRGS